MIYLEKKSIVELPKATGSIVDTFNIDDKTTNAPSLRLMIDLLYPIGRGFIDFTDTNYSNWLGLTWERELLGMFPVGYKPEDTDFGTIGKIGGEKTHTLTINEMPAHFHNETVQYKNGKGLVDNATPWGQVIDGATGSLPMQTSTTGGDQPHNNLPPYQVVSYWKRVDPNATKLISFTIDGISYQAEDGMTWYNWCNSNYNTSTWVCTSSTQTKILHAGGSEENYLALKSGYKTTACITSDVIIANHAYGTGSTSK